MASRRRSRSGTWLVLGSLAVLLVFAFAFLYVGWGMGGSDALDHGQQMSGAGYVAMTFGIIVTLSLGIGLMALIFYSNRKGHDQGTVLETIEREERRPNRSRLPRTF